MGALARGGAAPHNPGGNLRKLSRPQAVHARPAGAGLCGLSCWSGGLLGWLPSSAPGHGVLQLSTPALLVGARVLELAEGDSGLGLELLLALPAPIRPKPGPSLADQVCLTDARHTP